MCVCVHMYRYVYVHMWVSRTETDIRHLLYFYHVILWDSLSHWTQSLLIGQTGRPASPRDSQAPGLEMYTATPGFYVGAMVPIRSSCLHTRHFADRDISLDPLFLYGLKKPTVIKNSLKRTKTLLTFHDPTIQTPLVNTFQHNFLDLKNITILNI